MTTASTRSFNLITEKLGFEPWGGCNECPYLAYCKQNERRLLTLPCELTDREANIDPNGPPRYSSWDAAVRASSPPQGDTGPDGGWDEADEMPYV